MSDYHSYFSPIELLLILIWICLAAALYIRSERFGVAVTACLISVPVLVGYLHLISFRVLGAGWVPGLLFPGFDAFIHPFLLHFFGIPAIMLLIVATWAVDVWRAGGPRLVSTLFVGTSLYLSWVVLNIHIAVIASI